MAAFTGTLWWSTNKLWVVTKRAADISERALVELERPHVFIEVTSAGIAWGPDGRATIGPLPRFRYDFTNYGRSPAVLITIAYRAAHRAIGDGAPDALPLIAPMPADTRVRNIPVGVMVGPNVPYFENENPIALFDAVRIIDENWWREEQVFWHGWFRYSDTSGRDRYIVGFCFVFDIVGNRFVLTGGPEHNYTRKE